MKTKDQRIRAELDQVLKAVPAAPRGEMGRIQSSLTQGNSVKRPFFWHPVPVFVSSFLLLLAVWTWTDMQAWKLNKLMNQPSLILLAESMETSAEITVETDAVVEEYFELLEI